MSDRRIDGYAGGLFEIARAEGNLDEVEDELFRFARSLEGSDAAAQRPHRRAGPGRAAPGHRRGPARQGVATTDAARRPRRRLGRGRDLPAIISTLVERRPRPKKDRVAEVRSAVPLTDDQQARPGRRPRQRHRQAGRAEGRRRPVGARRRSPPSATPSSTAPSAPDSTSSSPSCRRHRSHMAELTISAADIAAALKKNLEGFEPSLEARTVGRVTEVGDGIARVYGLPDAAVNELLEFEDGTVGLALNLDEDSIGAVVLGDSRASRRARPSRPPAASCRCPSATPCSAGSSTPSASRSTARARPRRRSRAGWRSRPPAWAASPCTSRCRPASRPSTP